MGGFCYGCSGLMAISCLLLVELERVVDAWIVTVLLCPCVCVCVCGDVITTACRVYRRVLTEHLFTNTVLHVYVCVYVQCCQFHSLPAHLAT